MLKDLYTGVLPTNLDYKVPINSHNWDILYTLWNQCPVLSSYVKFTIEEVKAEGSCWILTEDLTDFHFKMKRSRLNHYRTTLQDDTGLIGLSMIDPKIPHCILTEGVSDFISAKLLCPCTNVLGLTTLSGNDKAKQILLSLFDKFIYCADNDATGLQTSLKVKDLMNSYGKSLNIFTPPSPNKDISDAFIANIKQKYYV